MSMSSSSHSPGILMNGHKPEYETEEHAISRFAFSDANNESVQEMTLLLETFGTGDCEDYTTHINNNKDRGKRYARRPRTRSRRTKQLDAHHDKPEFRNQHEGYAKTSSRKRGEQKVSQQVLHYFDLELKFDSLSVSDVSMTDDDQSMQQLWGDEDIVVKSRSHTSEHESWSSNKKSSLRRQESSLSETNRKIQGRDEKNKQDTREYSNVVDTSLAGLLRDGFATSKNLPFQRSFRGHTSSTFSRRIYRRTQSERRWQHHAEFHNGVSNEPEDQGRHNDRRGLTTPAVQLTKPSPIDAYLASPEWTELQRIKEDWRCFLKRNREKSIPTMPSDVALSPPGTAAHERL
jgi:hypothetical protein